MTRYIQFLKVEQGTVPKQPIKFLLAAVFDLFGSSIDLSNRLARFYL
ncbi:MAG: hypothetical protein P1U77_25105 [Rubripirellula sp.]|nr:hypothetical protein [Rubripirellula sp.]